MCRKIFQYNAHKIYQKNILSNEWIIFSITLYHTDESRLYNEHFYLCRCFFQNYEKRCFQKVKHKIMFLRQLYTMNISVSVILLCIFIWNVNINKQNSFSKEFVFIFAPNILNQADYVIFKYRGGGFKQVEKTNQMILHWV